MEKKEKEREQEKDKCFINCMFYSDEIETYYTEVEETIKENIEALKEKILDLDQSELYAKIDDILSCDYFLYLLGHVISKDDEINENFINRLTQKYDEINTFFKREGDNSINIINEYGDIINTDDEGFYKLNDTIVNKVLDDNDFYISDDETKESIKQEIFNTWENQKELLTQEKLDKYSESRNGINFKHFVFCEEYIKTGKIKTTCDSLGISRNTAYTWLKDKKVLSYLEERKEEIKKETEATFLSTYRQCFDELNDLIKGSYTNNSDKIKAIDTFLKHYINIERIKQPTGINDD